jgi:hypothetical protein
VTTRSVATSLARSPLAGLIARIFAWLPATFAIWYFAAPILLAPAAFLIELAARSGLADIVRGVEQTSTELAFATTLKAGSAGAQGGEIVVAVNLLLYSFGMPLYAALVLAAKEPRWPRRLLVGYAVLIPFVAWGALADFLQSIAITMGPQIASQTGFVAWQREAIAFSYQFGALILPTVVPVVAWVVTHRALLERLRAQPGAA